MGHYGCYLDCTEKVSMPLRAEATVNLIRRRPVSPLLAHGKWLLSESPNEHMQKTSTDLNNFSSASAYVVN